MSKPPFYRLTKQAKFYFVRHGNSVANSAGVYQGRSNSKLSELGHEQARRTGAWFRDQGVTRVLSSPLDRAAETARIMSAQAGLCEPEALEELIEIDIGLFSNLPPAEIKERFPDDWERFQRHSWEAVPRAERITSLRQRVRAVWDRLIEEANSGHEAILCVSHGGFMQWILKSTFGAIDHWLPLVRISNCGVFRYRAHAVDERNAYGIWDMINHQVTNGSRETTPIAGDRSRLG